MEHLLETIGYMQYLHNRVCEVKSPFLINKFIQIYSERSAILVFKEMTKLLLESIYLLIYLLSDATIHIGPTALGTEQET